jgi:hypothetical protein
MINILYLQQLYKHKEIAEIKQIIRNTNLANILTKRKRVFIVLK